MITKTKAEAIAHLLSKTPLDLDGTKTYVDRERPASPQAGFENEHEFVVSIPAWVFRALLRKDDTASSKGEP